MFCKGHRSCLYLNVSDFFDVRFTPLLLKLTRLFGY